MQFTYKQLKSWRGLGKAFMDFSWENLVAAGVGGWLGYQLSDLLPFLPFWLAYPPPILAGIALTWPYQGRLVYVLVALWIRYYGRRWLAPATLEIYSQQYYRQPLPASRGIVSDILIIDPTDGPTGAGHRSALPPGLRMLPGPEGTPAPARQSRSPERSRRGGPG